MDARSHILGIDHLDVVSIFPSHLRATILFIKPGFLFYFIFVSAQCSCKAKTTSAWYQSRFAMLHEVDMSTAQIYTIYMQAFISDKIGIRSPSFMGAVEVCILLSAKNGIIFIQSLVYVRVLSRNATTPCYQETAS